MAKKNNLKVGDHVQSKYRSNWKGIVINRLPRYNDGTMCILEVVVMMSGSGRPLKKRLVHKYHDLWFKPTTINKENIREDWLF